MNEVLVRNNKDPRGQGMFSRTGQFTSELNPILMMRDDLISGRKSVFKLHKGTLQHKEEASDDNLSPTLTVLQKLALQNQEKKDEVVKPDMSKYTGRANHFLTLYKNGFDATPKKILPKRIKARSEDKRSDNLVDDNTQAVTSINKNFKIPLFPEPLKVEPYQKQRSVLDYSKQVKSANQLREKIEEVRVKAESARQESLKSLVGLHPHVCRGMIPPKTYKQGIVFSKFTPREILKSPHSCEEELPELGTTEASQTSYSVRFLSKSIGRFAKAPKPPNFTEVQLITKNIAYEPNFKCIQQKKGGFPGFAKTTGRFGKDPKIEEMLRAKLPKRNLLGFEKSARFIIENERRSTRTSQQITSFGMSRSNFNIKRETLVKSRGLDMKRGLPRYTDPNSKLPAWMQKGVFLRGMQNEKFFENTESAQIRNTSEKDMKKPMQPKETAEEYLAKWYLMAQSLNTAGHQVVTM